MRILLMLACTIPGIDAQSVTATRLARNPILSPSSSATLGDNLNGPSLIRVPAWVAKPLGRYYLYFAHHTGTYIRLAYADRIEGPWKVHEPGTLRLEQASECQEHIASPDIHMDDAAKQIRMYFHCPVPGRTAASSAQHTLVAISSDGLHFTPRPGPLGPAYFRVFQHGGWYYAISRGGEILRSRDGLTPFEKGPNPFAGANLLRHAAVDLRGSTLAVYYSRIGDAPESLLFARIHLSKDWSAWHASAPLKILEPREEWEGANLPVAPSKPDRAPGRVNELRDPAIFREGAKTYLLYSVAGGIAIAEVNRKFTRLN